MQFSADGVLVAVAGSVATRNQTTHEPDVRKVVEIHGKGSITCLSKLHSEELHKPRSSTDITGVVKQGGWDGQNMWHER
jgi:hypothetical protein